MKTNQNHKKDNAARTRQYFLKIFVFSLAVLTLSASSGTGVTPGWADTHSQGPAPENVMIAGLAQNPDNRALFEKILVKEFARQGITATPGLSLMSDAGNTATAELLAQARKAGIDFVIVTRVVDITEKEILVFEYNPILFAYEGGGNPYSEVDKFRKKTRLRETFYTLETHLYDSKTEKIIWTGVAETEKPDSIFAPREVIASVCRVISKKLDAADTRG